MRSSPKKNSVVCLLSVVCNQSLRSGAAGSSNLALALCLLLAIFGHFGLLWATFGYFGLLWATLGYFWLLVATFGYFWLLWQSSEIFRYLLLSSAILVIFHDLW